MKIISLNIFRAGKPTPEGHLFSTVDKAVKFLKECAPDVDPALFQEGVFINTSFGMVRFDEVEGGDEIPT